MSKVFTTGQVAKICKVAPRTVSKWFDSGRLKGYRIPGSNDRRIPRGHLVSFLKDNGMPFGELEGECCYRVLTVGAEPAFAARLREALAGEGYRHESARTAFDAGVLAESFRPDAVVLDLYLGRSESLQIAQSLRQLPQGVNALLVALAGDDEPDPGALAKHGFNDVFKKPLDPALVAERVRAAADAAREEFEAANR